MASSETTTTITLDRDETIALADAGLLPDRSHRWVEHLLSVAAASVNTSRVAVATGEWAVGTLLLGFVPDLGRGGSVDFQGSVICRVTGVLLDDAEVEVLAVADEGRWGECEEDRYRLCACPELVWRRLTRELLGVEGFPAGFGGLLEPLWEAHEGAGRRPTERPSTAGRRLVWLTRELRRLGLGQERSPWPVGSLFEVVADEFGRLRIRNCAEPGPHGHLVAETDVEDVDAGATAIAAVLDRVGIPTTNGERPRGLAERVEMLAALMSEAEARLRRMLGTPAPLGKLIELVEARLATVEGSEEGVEGGLVLARNVLASHGRGPLGELSRVLLVLHDRLEKRKNSALARQHRATWNSIAQALGVAGDPAEPAHMIEGAERWGRVLRESTRLLGITDVEQLPRKVRELLERGESREPAPGYTVFQDPVLGWCAKGLRPVTTGRKNGGLTRASAVEFSWESLIGWAERDRKVLEDVDARLRGWLGHVPGADPQPVGEMLDALDRALAVMREKSERALDRARGSVRQHVAFLGSLARELGLQSTSRESDILEEVKRLAGFSLLHRPTDAPAEFELGYSAAWVPDACGAPAVAGYEFEQQDIRRSYMVLGPAEYESNAAAERGHPDGDGWVLVRSLVDLPATWVGSDVEYSWKGSGPNGDLAASGFVRVRAEQETDGWIRGTGPDSSVYLAPPGVWMRLVAGQPAPS